MKAFGRVDIQMPTLLISALALGNGQLRNLYSSPSINRLVKSRKTGWVGHVARMCIKRHAHITLL
jgi:hypothetical protein